MKNSIKGVKLSTKKWKMTLMGYLEKAQRSADGSIWSHPTTALLQIGQVVVEKATTQVANTTGICSNPLISDR